MTDDNGKTPAPIVDPHPTTAMPVVEGWVIEAEVVEPNAISLPAPDAIDLDEDHAIMGINRNRIFRHAIEKQVQLPTGELGEPDFEEQAAEAVGVDDLLAAFYDLDAAKDGTSDAHKEVAAWREECRNAHVEQLTEAWSEVVS